jgi:hypothetical protein
MSAKTCPHGAMTRIGSVTSLVVKSVKSRVLVQKVYKKFLPSQNNRDGYAANCPSKVSEATKRNISGPARLQVHASSHREWPV